jgi:hypothetical protein
MQKGDRVRLNAYYLRSFSRTQRTQTARVGTVVAMSRNRQQTYVQWDGRKSVDVLGSDYLDRDEQAETESQIPNRI